MNTCAACETLLGPTARWVTVLRDPQFLVITTGSRLWGRSFLRQMNAAIEAIGHVGSRNLGAGPPWGPG